MTEPGFVFELVDKMELVDPGKMWDKSIEQTRPEFMQYFIEYHPALAPSVLSLGSYKNTIFH